MGFPRLRVLVFGNGDLSCHGCKSRVSVVNLIACREISKGCNIMDEAMLRFSGWRKRCPIFGSKYEHIVAKRRVVTNFEPMLGFMTIVDL